MRFLDTNVLIYSISGHPADAVKRDIATGLLASDDNALSVQVLQEFYVEATRPTRLNPATHEAATDFVRSMLRFPVQDITVPVLTDALEIKAAHRLSYWDATIVAAARALGCSEVLSEDLSHGREIEGVRITNPFR